MNFRVCLSILVIFYYSNAIGQTFDPTAISGLQLWLNADSGVTVDGSMNVTQWDDISGNNNDFIQGTAANRPAYVSNNLFRTHALKFNGSSNELINNSLLNGTNFPAPSASVFIVWGLNGTVNQYGVMSTLSGGDGYWRFGGDGNGYMQNFRNNRLSGYPSNMPSRGSYFSSLIVSPSSYTFYLNKNSKGIQSSDWGYGANFIIGKDENSNYLNGEVAEVIAYNGALNDSLRGLVEHYLQFKYAPPVNLGADITKTNTCPTTLQAHASWYTGYHWSTGATTDSIIISSSGTYSVTVTDIFGFTSSDTIAVTYPGNLSPYPGNVTSLCAGSSVLWNTNLSPSQYSFAWSNGATTSAINITQAGQYSVTVTDLLSCTRVSNTVTVTVDNFPQTATLGPDVSMCSGASIGLTQGASQAASYLWSTGETAASISIVTTGTYSVSVTNIKGCIARDTINIIVQGTAPVVDFSAPSVCSADSLKFADLSSSTNTLTNWLWDFGDTKTSTAQNPSHLYIAGIYSVKLMVTNAVGCSNFIVKNVTVKPLPIPGFIGMQPFCHGDTVWFTDTSKIASGTILSWQWNFGDPSSGGNNASIQQNSVHAFSSPGGYDVKLIVVSNQGCKDSILRVLNVVYNPACTLPTAISGLQLWLNADSGVTVDGSMNVTQWDDISGNNNDFIQGTAANRPAYVSNNLFRTHALKFNGSSNELINNSLLNGTNFPAPSASVFIVWGLNGTVNQYGVMSTLSGGDGYWRFGGDGNGYMQNFRNNRLSGYPSNMPSRGSYFSSLIISPSSYTFYLNKNSKGIQSSDWGYGANFIIGKDENSNYLNGEVAEVIAYNGALNDSLRGLVEHYLQFKYAPPVNLGADITKTNTCPTTLQAHASWYTGYHWSTGATTDSIIISSSGTYSVTVTDIFGFTSSDTIAVTYPGNLSPYPGNVTSLCAGSSVLWNTNLSPSQYSFAWSNGATTSAINITQAGQYSVTVTDLLSCTRVSNTVTVTVDNFPQTATLGPDVSMCSGASIGLTQGASQAASYLWSTGETTSAIIMSTMGVNSYSLKVKDVKGCTAKDTIMVNIKGIMPTPDFTASVTCQGNKTLFSDLTTATTPDSIATWNWSFGDGMIASTQNTSHIYSAAGTYTASLNVISDSGCVAFIQKPVLVNPVPNANFNIASSPICTGLNAQFMDVSTISNGSMVSWKWDFGDMSPVSNLKNPAHTYASGGTYSVQLVVTSALGCEDTFVSVQSVAQSPSALFTADTVCKGNATVFKDQSLGVLSNWLWSFGDGSNSTLKNATHTYSLAGTYTTSLLVTAANGCTNAITGGVVVNYLPSAGFKGTSACLNTPLQLTDISTVTGSTINSWNWQFAGAGSSSLQNPFVIYSISGTYSISLKVISGQGCSASATQTVSVKPLPVANFSLTPAYSYPQQAVNFYDLSTGGITYHWFFGDGGKDSIRNPVHTYQDIGTYSILLVTENAFGCRDSFTQYISIDIPVLDIEISDMFAMKSNTVQVSVLLKNIGTLDVTNIELSAYLNDGTPIHEFWTGLVRPDSLVTYPFHSSFELSNNMHSIVCVEVKKVNGQSDNVSLNNKKCNAITDEFTVLNPFPNPTINEIYFLFVVPDVSNVKAQVFDSRGRLIASPFDGNASTGLNQIVFNTTNLEKGMYLLKLSYKDKIATKMFVKE